MIRRIQNYFFDRYGIALQKVALRGLLVLCVLIPVWLIIFVTRTNVEEISPHKQRILNEEVQLHVEADEIF